MTGGRVDGSSGLTKGAERINGHFFAQSSWAQHALATERNVVKVDPSAPLEMLGPLGCGIQTGAGAVINVLKPQMGQSLVVFGAGAVGMAAIMAAKAVGVGTLIAVGEGAPSFAKTRRTLATSTEVRTPLLAEHAVIRTPEGFHEQFGCGAGRKYRCENGHVAARQCRNDFRERAGDRSGREYFRRERKH